jgi:hypothetical protein
VCQLPCAILAAVTLMVHVASLRQRLKTNTF